MKRLLFSALGAASMVAVSQAQDTNLWDVASPSGGTMNLAAGVFDSSATTSGTNTSSFGTTADWSAYGNRGWTFSFDVYVTSAQLANTNINDDTISYELLDGTNVLSSGGNLTLANASWWTADAWNRVIWQGTFPGTASQKIGNPGLSNVTFAIVNDDKGTHDAGSNYTLANIELVANIPNYETVIWDDQAPSGYQIAFGTAQETDVTTGGTDSGRGSVATYNSNDQGGQWANFGNNQNFSQYEGAAWQMSCDLYMTSAQIADAANADDNLYFNVNGGGGLFVDLGDVAVADEWTTVTVAGEFPVGGDLSGGSYRFLINDKGTHSGSAAAYFDNLKFETEFAPPPGYDTLWSEAAPSGGMFTLVTNEYGVVGEFNSDKGGQWENYGTYNNDWTNYAGQAWTFSFDMLVPAANIGDTNVTDDLLYYSIAGANDGYQNVSNTVTVGDTWTTVTWTGTFDSNPNNLTNAFARLQNNDNATHPTSMTNYYVRNFLFEGATPNLVVDNRENLWVDTAPNTGILTGISDPFATDQGTIGMFKSAEAAGLSYGVENQYWAAHAGETWTLTFDVYVISNNLADSNVSDDVLSYSVAGVTGGSTPISSLPADEWTTITWMGTFSSLVDDLGIAEALIVINDNGTDPVSGPNYFFDNISLKAINNVPETEKSYVAKSTSIDFTSGEGYADGDVDGQNGWMANGGSNWVVSTASDSVSCTNANQNMTLDLALAAGVSNQIVYKARFKPMGIRDGADGWRYLARMGVATEATATGDNVGYDNSGESNESMHFYMQSNQNPGQYRLWGSGWGGSANPASSSPTVGSSAGDEFELTQVITVGDSEATTTYMVYLTNLNTLASVQFGSPKTGVGENMYDALKNGTAYPYFETAALFDDIPGVELTGISVDYYVLEIGGFDAWLDQQGLVGVHRDADNDLDADGMELLGEYAFGGDPMPATGSGDIGVIPTYDGSTGDYAFSVFGDDMLTVNVMTNDNLAVGTWNVFESVVVPASGSLDAHNVNVPTDGGNAFIRLEVSQ